MAGNTISLTANERTAPREYILRAGGDGVITPFSRDMEGIALRIFYSETSSEEQIRLANGSKEEMMRLAGDRSICMEAAARLVNRVTVPAYGGDLAICRRLLFNRSFTDPVLRRRVVSEVMYPEQDAAAMVAEPKFADNELHYMIAEMAISKWVLGALAMRTDLDERTEHALVDNPLSGAHEIIAQKTVNLSTVEKLEALGKVSVDGALRQNPFYRTRCMVDPMDLGAIEDRLYSSTDGTERFELLVLRALAKGNDRRKVADLFGQDADYVYRQIYEWNSSGIESEAAQEGIGGGVVTELRKAV